MDVYHKVLVNVYSITGGKDSVTVDLKDVVKSHGFLGNYDDIFEMLSGQGWIAETPKTNFVKITHWGVKEAKKSDTGESSNMQHAKKELARLVSDAKQFLIMLEEFSSDMSLENFGQVEKKLSDVSAAVSKIKATL